MKQPGKFITIEGIEGAGKTTCLDIIAKQLTQQGITVMSTREPGGTPLGEALRELLLGHQQAGMSSDAELLLLFAARAEHIQQRIRPALAEGQWVLCDRFTDASYAYQGAGRGLDITRITTLVDWVQKGLKPDLTLLLDISPEEGLQRAKQRSMPDRFEAETYAFFAKVRAGYQQLAAQEPERIVLVDASQSLQQVQAAIQQLINGFLHGY
jgi:dTMP kinase